MDKTFILAVASLVGAIVGAGVFALPLIIFQSGVLIFLLFCFILGAVAFFLHLCLAEVALQTKDKHRLAGYANQYLGKKGKFLVGIATAVGSVGALLAYLILSGKFLALLLPSVFNEFWGSLACWGLFALLLVFKTKVIVYFNFLAEILLFLAVGCLLLFALPEVSLANFSIANSANWLAPFGVLLFSFVGWNAIPDAIDILKNKQKAKKAVALSFGIAFIFYLIFGFIVAGVAGALTTEDSFTGLALLLGKKIILLAALFGFFNIADSFLVVGLYLKNSFKLDWKMPPVLAFVLVASLPLALFLAGLNSFIIVVGMVGVFTGVIEGTAICLIYNRLKTKPISPLRFLSYLAIMILCLGGIAEILRYVV